MELTQVILLVLLGIIIFIILHRSKKETRRKKPECDKNETLVYKDGEWTCEQDIICDISKKPECLGDETPLCNDDIWSCNYYKVEGDDQNIGKSCYPSYMRNSSYQYNIPNLEEATEICDTQNCIYYNYRPGYQDLFYTPNGVENKSFVSGFRIMPYESNLFKRFDNIDMTNYFTSESVRPETNFGYYKVSSIDDCENRCVLEWACQHLVQGDFCNCNYVGFGYIYNKDNGDCTVYVTDHSSYDPKYVKNI